jgi:hypothetical protein
MHNQMLYRAPFCFLVTVLLAIRLIARQFFCFVKAENELAHVKDRREKGRARIDPEGATMVPRLRLERECTWALERGVDNNVRLSYGCSD